MEELGSILLYEVWAINVIQFNSIHIHKHDICIPSGYSILERAGLPKFPETVLIAIGEVSGMEAVLLHHVLRNTVIALYMIIQHPKSVFVTPRSRILSSKLRLSGNADVY